MDRLSADTVRDPRVDDRVLAMLAETSGRIAFNGLRRALGVHPETLTRALRRLERDGTVVRSDGGYVLREPSPGPDDSVPRTRTIAELELPDDVRPDDVRGRMAGHWFGSLRWVGIYEHAGDPWLVWSSGSGLGNVMLSIHRGRLRVLADAGVPARDGLDRAGSELLARALERLAPPSHVDPPSMRAFWIGAPAADLRPN
ncbi:MAG: GntR family transcriptional regulator [Thermoplasmata archaeon]|nr:GntR family transcriptional regulator [Thermoplasmata archaeon]